MTDQYHNMNVENGSIKKFLEKCY